MAHRRLFAATKRPCTSSCAMATGASSKVSRSDCSPASRFWIFVIFTWIGPGAFTLPVRVSPYKPFGGSGASVAGAVAGNVRFGTNPLRKPGVLLEHFVTTIALIGVVIIIASLLSGVVERNGLPLVAAFLG